MHPDDSHELGQTDTLDLARANALLSTLCRPERLQLGDPLPPFFHQIYFWDVRPSAALGRDGHPKVGLGLVPDLGLPRRMWAGGRLEFLSPLLVGVPAQKVTRLDSVEKKSGRTGPLAFVTLRHEIWQDGALSVVELQDLVYREDPDSTRAPPKPPAAPHSFDTVETLSTDTTLLFRYSALTMNGHKIHYDLGYAKNDEGYAGLVVHGPLLAQLLMLKAQDELGPLDRFAFRGVSPMVHSETATLGREGNQFWVAGPDNRLVMTAEV